MHWVRSDILSNYREKEFLNFKKLQWMGHVFCTFFPLCPNNYTLQSFCCLWRYETNSMDILLDNLLWCKLRKNCIFLRAKRGTSHIYFLESRYGALYSICMDNPFVYSINLKWHTPWNTFLNETWNVITTIHNFCATVALKLLTVCFWD